MPSSDQGSPSFPVLTFGCPRVSATRSSVEDDASTTNTTENGAAVVCACTTTGQIGDGGRTTS